MKFVVNRLLLFSTAAAADCKQPCRHGVVTACAPVRSLRSLAACCGRAVRVVMRRTDGRTDRQTHRRRDVPNLCLLSTVSRLQTRARLSASLHLRLSLSLSLSLCVCVWRFHTGGQGGTGPQIVARPQI